MWWYFSIAKSRDTFQFVLLTLPTHLNFPGRGIPSGGFFYRFHQPTTTPRAIFSRLEFASSSLDEPSFSRDSRAGLRRARHPDPQPSKQSQRPADRPWVGNLFQFCYQISPDLFSCSPTFSA